MNKIIPNKYFLREMGRYLRSLPDKDTFGVGRIDTYELSNRMWGNLYLDKFFYKYCLLCFDRIRMDIPSDILLC